jgi:hypothetical protein
MSYFFYFLGGFVALAAIFGVILGRRRRRRGLDSPDAATREHVSHVTKSVPSLGGRFGGPGSF